MSDRVTCTINDGVADVRLSRPDKLNALDQDMFGAIAATGDKLASNSEVRAVVLSGEGRSFCAGLDMGMFAGAFSDKDGGPKLLQREKGAVDNLAQHVAWVWQSLKVPVIAAVHGACLGGGLQIALGADIRIVTPDAKMSVLEIRWGLIPDMTGTWTLRRLVGLDVAKELTWTGRMVSGAEAVKLGLATKESDDPRAAAMEMARDIAGRSPGAIRAAKVLFDETAPRTAAEQLALEEKKQIEMFKDPNQAEAVMAFMEKRPPAFKDPSYG